MTCYNSYVYDMSLLYPVHVKSYSLVISTNVICKKSLQNIYRTFMDLGAVEKCGGGGSPISDNCGGSISMGRRNNGLR